MTIQYLEGDATQIPPSQILVHCCNNVGAWGHGFVTAVSKQWWQPQTEYEAWYRRCRNNGEILPLGVVQFVDVSDPLETGVKYVGNMIGQVLGSSVGPNVRYSALAECLKRVAEFADSLNLGISSPRFGSALAGGSWDVIESLIYENVPGHIDFTVYDYSDTSSPSYVKQNG